MGNVKGFAGIKFRGLPLNPRKPRNLVPAKFSTFKVDTKARFLRGELFARINFDWLSRNLKEMVCFVLFRQK